MKTNFPLISIITPSYNSAKYIEDCVQSVLNQNYPNFEHIIIDGGSTDGTIDILKKYPHLKWISEPDTGQSDALNKAVGMIKGEILGWQNSDDYYLPNTFSKIIGITNEYNKDIIFADCMFIDKQNYFLRLKREPKFDKNLLLYYGCYIPSVSIFFNLRKVKKAHIKFDEKLHNVMDFDLYLSLVKKGYDFTHIDDIWGVYRMYPENKSLAFGEQRKKERYLVQVRYSSFKFKNEKINRIMLEILRIIFKGKHILLKIIYGKYFVKR